MQHHRTYRYRLRPTAAQEQQLYRFAGARRWVWNWALATRRAAYAETKTTLGIAALCAELPRLKRQHETAWLREIDSQLLQQAIRDLDGAFQAFFAKRAGYPRFQSKKQGRYRFRIPQRVAVSDGLLSVPKIGRIAMRYHRPMVGTGKSATFTRDARGHWYVSLVVAFDGPDVHATLPPIERTVGIDVGLKDFAVLSDGTRVAAPRFYRTSERRLRRAQQALSRKQRASRNRGRAKRNIARVHARVTNQRADFLHKLSGAIVQTYDAVCVENLNVRGLAKTKLAKSIHDAAWSSFRFMLTYKTLWQTKQIVTIGRFYASSRLCRQCGRANADLELSDRVWTCPCGRVHDRDLNAAQNIQHEGYRLLAAGHADRINACGQPISLPLGARLVEPRSPPL